MSMQKVWRISERSYRANRERFSVNSTVLIPIDYIPPVGWNYHLTIEPANKLMVAN